MKSRKYFIISCLSVLVFLGVWYLCTKVLGLVEPTSLPDPVSVVQTFFYKFTNKAPDGATLMQHMYSSLRIALYGYFLSIVIGVPLGILMAWYKPVDMLARPVFDFVKAIPGLAWAPMMIVLLGIGLTSKAVTVFISGMIPCVLNAYAGIKQTREVHLWVARTFGASRWQMLFRVAIPTALPYIMTGVRVSLGACWMTIVAAEMVASSSGLGYMIQQCRGIYRPDIIIVGMVMIGFLGSLLNALLGVIERMVVKGRNYDQ
ncbi:ABC transporter permease [uncultured Ruthenibacterium sp.]|uniref:ABC transporter permease n=1 Tax=uncultured Ruthenibacterium sp. TaxID=1905347 RepID=UPI00349E58B5